MARSKYISQKINVEEAESNVSPRMCVDFVAIVAVATIFSFCDCGASPNKRMCVVRELQEIARLSLMLASTAPLSYLRVCCRPLLCKCEDGRKCNNIPGIPLPSSHGGRVRRCHRVSFPCGDRRKTSHMWSARSRSWGSEFKVMP